MKLNDKIFLAGHSGLVGSAIFRLLKLRGFSKILTRTHAELDLTNQLAVENFFVTEKPAYVILAAAKVGGILANDKYSADFIYQNIMIEANVINAAYHSKVKRLLFLGSTCIYPKAVKQPMQERALLTGVLEPTNEAYAVAKIAGIKLCESFNKQYGTDFRSIMPTNLYGENDNFDLMNSHVLPAIIRKLHLAKLLEDKNWNAINSDIRARPIKNIGIENSSKNIIKELHNVGICYDSNKNKSNVILWGSGKPMREFLYVDDMASASLFVLELDKEKYQRNTKENLSHINVGSGVDISIRELAETIKRVIGYKGDISFDNSKPDGTMRKLVDVNRLSNLGWSYEIGLDAGIKLTYEKYLLSNS